MDSVSDREPESTHRWVISETNPSDGWKTQVRCLADRDTNSSVDIVIVYLYVTTPITIRIQTPIWTYSVVTIQPSSMSRKLYHLMEPVPYQQTEESTCKKLSNPPLRHDPTAYAYLSVQAGHSHAG